MNCNEMQEQFAALIYDELDPSTKAQILAHIDDCDACRMQYEGLKAAANLLVEAFAEMPQMKLDETRREELAVATKPRFPHYIPFRSILLQFAAVFAIVGAVCYFTLTTSRSERQYGLADTTEGPPARSGQLDPSTTLNDGKVYGCPSATGAGAAEESTTDLSEQDDKELPASDEGSVCDVAYDNKNVKRTGSKWINPLFVDGHVDGAKPKNGAKDQEPKPNEDLAVVDISDEAPSAPKEIDDNERIRRRRQLSKANRLIKDANASLVGKDYVDALDKYTQSEKILKDVSNSTPSVLEKLESLRKTIGQAHNEYALQNIKLARKEVDTSKFDQAESSIAKAIEYDPSLKPQAQYLSKVIGQQRGQAEIDQATMAEDIDPEYRKRLKEILSKKAEDKVFAKHEVWKRARNAYEDILLKQPGNQDAVTGLKKLYNEMKIASKERRRASEAERMAEIEWKWIDPATKSAVPGQAKVKKSKPQSVTKKSGEVSETKKAQLQAEFRSKLSLHDEKRRQLTEPPSDRAPKEIDGGKYVVQPGDSLWKVAKMYKVSSKKIMQLNGLKDHFLVPGKKLIIPHISSEAIAANPPARNAIQSKNAAGAPLAFTMLPHYVDKDKDTLKQIAKMYGSKVEWIRAANPDIKSDKDLLTAKEIRVPVQELNIGKKTEESGAIVAKIDEIKKTEPIAPKEKIKPVTEPLKPAVFKPTPVNPFVMAATDCLSTFALDTDTASYSLMRKYVNSGKKPPVNSVRMEEYVNNFDYNYPRNGKGVFAVHSEAAPSPFGKDLVLMKIGVKAKVIGRDGQRPSNLTFAVDTSGSMAQPDRMPLVKAGLKSLVGKLKPNDRVSLATYGRNARLVLDNCPAKNSAAILKAVDSLQCGESTHLASGVKLAYQVARRNFKAGQINSVILCSDGMANLGPQDAASINSSISFYRRQGISFNSVGFGIGNYNDNILEELANKGDGSYVFIDTLAQAKKVFAEEMGKRLNIVARDAKIQVKFNPKRVRRYRLIGYENRDIADKDFRNDAVDAGEVGSGQSATALYELELIDTPTTKDLDIGTVYVRCKNVETNAIEEISSRLSNGIIAKRTIESSPRFYLAAAVAEYAEILRQSEHAANGSLSNVEQLINRVANRLPLDQQVQEFKKLVHKSNGLPQER